MKNLGPPPENDPEGTPPDDPPQDLTHVIQVLSRSKGDKRACAWALVTWCSWTPELVQLIPLLELQLSEVDPDEDMLLRQLMMTAFFITKSDAATVPILARATASASFRLRIALIGDIMLTREHPDFVRLDSAMTARQCAALLSRTFPPPQDELALVFCESFRVKNFRAHASQLSSGARELLDTVVADPPPNIAVDLDRLAVLFAPEPKSSSK